MDAHSTSGMIRGEDYVRPSRSSSPASRSRSGSASSTSSSRSSASSGAPDEDVGVNVEQAFPDETGSVAEGGGEEAEHRSSEPSRESSESEDGSEDSENWSSSESISESDGDDDVPAALATRTVQIKEKRALQFPSGERVETKKIAKTKQWKAVDRRALRRFKEQRTIMGGEAGGLSAALGFLKKAGIGKKATDAAKTERVSTGEVMAGIEGIVKKNGVALSKQALDKIRGLITKLMPGGSIDVSKKVSDLLKSETVAAVRSGAVTTVKDMAGTAGQVIPELVSMLVDLFGKAVAQILPALIEVVVKSVVHAVTVGYPGDAACDALRGSRFGGRYTVGEFIEAMVREAVREAAYEWLAAGAPVDEAPDFDAYMDAEVAVARAEAEREGADYAMAPAVVAGYHALNRVHRVYTAGREDDAKAARRAAGNAAVRAKAGEIGVDVAAQTTVAAGHTAQIGSEIVKSMTEAAEDLRRNGKPSNMSDVVGQLGQTNELLAEVAVAVDKSASTDRSVARFVATIAGMANMFGKAISKMLLSLLKSEKFRESVQGISTGINTTVIKTADQVGPQLATGLVKAVGEIGKESAHVVTAGLAEEDEYDRMARQVAGAWGYTLTPQQLAYVTCDARGQPELDNTGFEYNFPQDLFDCYTIGRATAHHVPHDAMPWVMAHQMTTLLVLLDNAPSDVPPLLRQLCQVRPMDGGRGHALRQFDSAGREIADYMLQSPTVNYSLLDQADWPDPGSYNRVCAFLLGFAAQSHGAQLVVNTPIAAAFRGA